MRVDGRKIFDRASQNRFVARLLRENGFSKSQKNVFKKMPE